MGTNSMIFRAAPPQQGAASCACALLFARGAWHLTMHVGRTNRPRWGNAPTEGFGACAGVPIPNGEKASCMGLAESSPSSLARSLGSVPMSPRPQYRHTSTRLVYVVMHRWLCVVGRPCLSQHIGIIFVCIASSIAHGARLQLGEIGLKHSTCQQRCHCLPAAPGISGCTLGLAICFIAACWSEGPAWAVRCMRLC